MKYEWRISKTDEYRITECERQFLLDVNEEYWIWIDTLLTFIENEWRMLQYEWTNYWRRPGDSPWFRVGALWTILLLEWEKEKLKEGDAFLLFYVKKHTD